MPLQSCCVWLFFLAPRQSTSFIFGFKTFVLLKDASLLCKSNRIWRPVACLTLSQVTYLGVSISMHVMADRKKKVTANLTLSAMPCSDTDTLLWMVWVFLALWVLDSLGVLCWALGYCAVRECVPAWGLPCCGSLMLPESIGHMMKHKELLGYSLQMHKEWFRVNLIGIFWWMGS